MNLDWLTDGRKIPEDVMSYIRVMAVRAVSVLGFSPELIAKVYHFQRACIYRWLKQYERGGLAALESRTPPGARPRITAEMDDWLKEIVLTRTPVDFGYDSRLWTCGILAELLLDYASRGSKDIYFEAVKFSSFAEMGQALRQGNIDVGFMIAPLPIVLRQQGEPIKVVMIGTRHESTWVVSKDLNIKSVRDLVGKKVAVPMRFSGHNIAVQRLIDEHNLAGQINVVEMNPPDMASALAAGVLDSYFVGEPFATKTILSGQSEVLHYVEDFWPDFMSNVMAVREEFINLDPELVQSLVQAGVSSLAWARVHPAEAINIASGYWNQSPEVALYAVSHPPYRVRFDRYIPLQEQYQQMADFMVAFGLLGSNDIKGLVEDRFAEAAKFQDKPAADLIAAVGRRH